MSDYLSVVTLSQPPTLENEAVHAMVSPTHPQAMEQCGDSQVKDSETTPCDLLADAIDCPSWSGGFGRMHAKTGGPCLQECPAADLLCLLGHCDEVGREP